MEGEAGEVGEDRDGGVRVVVVDFLVILVEGGGEVFMKEGGIPGLCGKFIVGCSRQILRRRRWRRADSWSPRSGARRRLPPGDRPACAAAGRKSTRRGTLPSRTGRSCAAVRSGPRRRTGRGGNRWCGRRRARGRAG